MYLVPGHVTAGEMTADVEQLVRIASLVLTVPVVLYSAAPFFAGAWRDVRAFHVGMDVPVALGVGAGFAASVVATVTVSGQVYFDSVTMFVFLLLAARYLEMTARANAVVTQERLAQQAPAVAERLTAWPVTDAVKSLAVGALIIGDHLRVRPGAAVPANGVLVQGASDFDEQLLTGESRPQARHAGMQVTGGSINVGNPVVMRVTLLGANTTLAGILRLLDRAASEQPRLARIADRIAQYFVLVLLVFAAAVAVIWYQLDAARALWVTVAVLVASCPCALSLATPAALAAAIGAVHAYGVLITRANALEGLARAMHFVFDKTGTLTAGALRLVNVTPRAGSGDARAMIVLRLLPRWRPAPSTRLRGRLPLLLPRRRASRAVAVN